MTVSAVTPVPASPVPAPHGPAGAPAATHRFTLPRGYVDPRGRVHRDGEMRLATARDEIDPQADPRVRRNPAYLTVVVLARTITRLGDLGPIDTGVVEELYAADLAFLQELYRHVNQHGAAAADVACPGCGLAFPVALA